MADKEKKVDEAEAPVTEQAEQVELVGEAAKAEAEAIEALPKVEKAEVPKAEKTAAKPSKTPKGYKPRLKTDYDERIVQAMTEKFGYKNRLEVPRLDKIVINMGVGEATQDKKRVETAAAEMQPIAGQKPVITKAKKSIAQFKLREGMPIGCKVTLRRDRMYEFLDRLVTDRAAARPRLPRAQPEVVRRPRQLRDGPEGADRLPRDQLRPDREGPGHGRHRHHHREDGRGGARTAAPVQFPVPGRD